MRQIITYHHTKEYGPKENIITLQYKLDGKLHKQYQYMCQYGANNLFWYLPTEYTYELYPPDAGTGKQIKFWFGVYLYDWSWDSRNL